MYVWSVKKPVNKILLTRKVCAEIVIMLFASWEKLMFKHGYILKEYKFTRRQYKALIKWTNGEELDNFDKQGLRGAKQKIKEGDNNE